MLLVDPSWIKQANLDSLSASVMSMQDLREESNLQRFSFVLKALLNSTVTESLTFERV